MKTPTLKTRSGAALIVVLILVTFLAALTGAVVSNVSSKRATLNSSGTWELALWAAEAGIQQGIAQVSQGLANCTGDSLSGLILLPTPTSPVPTAATRQYGTAQTFSVALSNTTGTEGTVSYSSIYTITPFWQHLNGQSRPYYRIESTGTATLTGPKRVPNDFRDVVLRKLRLSGTTNNAVRKVEVLLRPIYTTEGAITTDKGLRLNNKNITVDTFDSSTTYSDGTPIPAAQQRNVNGLPTSTIGQFNVPPFPYDANIATNSQFIEAGNATIYGDASTNDGVVANSTNVLGQLRGDYNETLDPVGNPLSGAGAWTSYVAGAYVTGKNNNTTTDPSLTKTGFFVGGTITNPARYVVNYVKLSGAGDSLTFKAGLTGNDGLTGTADPSKRYIELYVKGDFSTRGGGGSGDGLVQIIDNVQVKIYVGGNLTVGGNGIVNGNTTNGVATPKASDLTIYGINPPSGTTQTFAFAGTSTFYGSVYAPGADATLAGGANGTYVGSLTTKSIFLNGNTQVRYDAALKSKGLIRRFAIASWFEDVKR